MRFAEAVRRDPDLKRPNGFVLVDGNKDQLARIRRAPRAAKVGVERITIVPRSWCTWIEYLWRARLRVSIASGSNEAEKWVDDRLLALLARGAAVGAPSPRSLRAMIKSHKLNAAPLRPKPVQSAPAKYLVNNTPAPALPTRRAGGRPADRDRRHRGRVPVPRQGPHGPKPGARWSSTGAEAVLQLRAPARTSGDFDD